MGDVHPAPALDYEFNLALEDLVPADPQAIAMFGAAEDVVRQSEMWRDAPLDDRVVLRLLDLRPVGFVSTFGAAEDAFM